MPPSPRPVSRRRVLGALAGTPLAAALAAAPIAPAAASPTRTAAPPGGAAGRVHAPDADRHRTLVGLL